MKFAWLLIHLKYKCFNYENAFVIQDKLLVLFLGHHEIIRVHIHHQRNYWLYLNVAYKTSKEDFLKDIRRNWSKRRKLEEKLWKPGFVPWFGLVTMIFKLGNGLITYLLKIFSISSRVSWNIMIIHKINIFDLLVKNSVLYMEIFPVTEISCKICGFWLLDQKEDAFFLGHPVTLNLEHLLF